MPRRKPRFRLWIWLSLLGLIALLALGTRHSGEPLALFRLADGSTVQIAALTLGPDHRFARGGPLRQLFAFLLPERVGNALGLHAFEQKEQDTRTPVLWITYTGRFATMNTFANGPDWTLVDTRNGERPAMELAGGFMDNNSPIHTLALRHYPRRSSKIRLKLHPDGLFPTPSPPLEGEVTNPFPGPYPQWSGHTPPIRATEPDLEVTLKAFRNGVSEDSTDQPFPGQRFFGQSTFVEVETRNPSASKTRWQPVNVAFLDATGNTYDPRRAGKITHRGTVSRLWSHWMLPYDEEAWKVRVELARTPDSPFAPSELWTIKDIPVPGWKDPGPSFSRSKTIGGITLEVQGIERGLPSSLWVHLPRDMTGTAVTLISLIDDRGRPVVRREESDRVSGVPSQWTTYHPKFDIRSGAKTLTAVLAFQKTRFVEFLATPTHVIPPSR